MGFFKTVLQFLETGICLARPRLTKLFEEFC